MLNSLHSQYYKLLSTANFDLYLNKSRFIASVLLRLVNDIIIVLIDSFFSHL